MNTDKIIDDLGGTSAVAEMCNVTPGAVSQWRENGIPEARLMYLRLLHQEVFSAIAAKESRKAELLAELKKLEEAA